MAAAMLIRAARGVRLGCFAITMATGIVSAALGLMRAPHPSGALLGIAAATFVLVLAGSAVRATTFPADLGADLAQPDRAFTAFAFVAACDVLGGRLAADGHRSIAIVLAGVALAAWAALTWLVPGRLIAQPRSPWITAANGSWYLWVVGIQSLAIAAILVAADGPALAITAWLIGVGLYLLVTTMVTTRLVRTGLRRTDATAPYWVAMGAASITVLAAADVIGAARWSPGSLARLAVTWLAVAFWGLATCLIPPLVGRSAWRHLGWREPLRYRADLWMIVFPAGMYATAGMRLGAVASLPVIRAVGTTAAWPAVIAWTMLFAAMIVSLTSRALAGGHDGAATPASRGKAAAAMNETWHDNAAHEWPDDDSPGDPACLLRRVCPDCGAVADADPPTTCPQCHADLPAD